jgi:hypothetical protein
MRSPEPLVCRGGGAAQIDKRDFRSDDLGILIRHERPSTSSERAAGLRSGAASTIGFGSWTVGGVDRTRRELRTQGVPVPLGGRAFDIVEVLAQSGRWDSAAVKAYLVGAGVPASEVSGTHVTTTMAGGGPVRDGVQPAQSKLLWYTTQLDRSLGGIPVESSYAFAAFDNGGRVIRRCLLAGDPRRRCLQCPGIRRKVGGTKGTNCLYGQSAKSRTGRRGYARQCENCSYIGRVSWPFPGGSSVFDCRPKPQGRQSANPAL